MWHAPLRARGIIRQYLIIYTEGVLFKMPIEILVEESQRDYTITGLTPATLYTVTIAAITVVRGPFSNEILKRTMESSKSKITIFDFMF